MDDINKRNIELRKKINEIITSHGIKAIHISHMTEIENGSFSKWRSGYKNFNESKLDSLSNFIDSI